MRRLGRCLCHCTLSILNFCNASNLCIISAIFYTGVAILPLPEKHVFAVQNIAMLGLFSAASRSSVIFFFWNCKTKQCKTERMFWVLLRMTTRARRRGIDRATFARGQALRGPHARVCTHQGLSLLPLRRSSQVKTRQDKTRQDKTREEKARQGKARQGKARQGKTRQDKARQDKASQVKSSQHMTRQAIRIFGHNFVQSKIEIEEADGRQMAAAAGKKR